ncbi:MFS transporter [Corynebacterium felinum]|uniref:MFS family arabinose efflux permease n=1 Tax=Corynebacterium felinum TaxID=131318 RepID=A0ABU2BBS0_9CORY|nr:MFS transporter [Corynebacterium felinum]MDF5819535.1 MFS transporter [Corynebacterium felinum]MDR7356082.1 putative MFS family arabinose efflux permease [Corynebacterium felinum]WJY95416.1 putative transporter [Corynebacterium felinum]
MIRGFLPLSCATAAAFGALALMLPVIPLAVIAQSGNETLAGASTTVFMAATVLTQLCTNAVIAKVGYRAVMIAASLLLGLPTLAYIVSMDPVVLMSVAAVRGVGFGSLCVAQFALIGHLSPPGMLGKVSGMIGFFTGGAQMVAVPAGLWLVDVTKGYTLVFSVGAAIALAAAALAFFIPSPSPDELNEEVEFNDDPRIYRRPRPNSLVVTIVPAIAIASVSMGYGAVSSFLPATLREVDSVSGATFAGVLLAVGGGAQMIFRYLSGVLADKRSSPGATMIPGQIMAICGFVGFVVVVESGWSLWWLFIPAFLFGAGFGLVANEALLEMFMRVPRAKVGQASTVWNASFDTGTGVGAVTLGYVASVQGYSGAYVVAAGLVVFGVFAEIADRVHNPEHR